MEKSSPLTSPWQLKPWWCQPWSIALTGLGLIAASWLLGHRWWLTAIVAVPITVWMGFFLVLWPRLMRQAGWLDPAAYGQPDEET
ncbi:DUF6737 family protein [Nodosilinea sp. P-1105]|uniref:DUF6737 family protein n=1 Tax=Nodosilinea sp. P-1105 TaxID=2546229 RepID=UPI00146C0AA5|nr:DUF6737 family protein [Nodosilinea sp. P-1105]NMF84040.1 hypothetical protein [Nodosilinea sp. P-1105]